MFIFVLGNGWWGLFWWAFCFLLKWDKLINMSLLRLVGLIFCCWPFLFWVLVIPFQLCIRISSFSWMQNFRVYRFLGLHMASWLWYWIWSLDISEDNLCHKWSKDCKYDFQNWSTLKQLFTPYGPRIVPFQFVRVLSSAKFNCKVYLGWVRSLQSHHQILSILSLIILKVWIF